ncbi:uncharacterized protein [Aegilops tauschii subsp. strangulata]|nr:E3 ubiquitin-protein ligase ATL41 [Aegilops tauschii subsp. strangulata]XP_044353116.1 E3 ubiquitin-protein ligase ATL41-like [Triticum aestivum]
MRGHAQRRPSASRNTEPRRGPHASQPLITSALRCVVLKPHTRPFKYGLGAPFPGRDATSAKRNTSQPLLACSRRQAPPQLATVPATQLVQLRPPVPSSDAGELVDREAISKMNAPSSWLFADNSKYSTRARLVFMGLSFAIGILTFLIYLAIWYTCSRRSRRQRGAGAADLEAGAADTAAAERGMSDAAIAALPTFAYEQAQADDAAVDCAVCLGQLEAGEKARRLPKCAHLFHAECVDAWLRAHCTCPMCRAPVGLAAATSSKKDGTTETTPAPATATATTETAEALPPV